ncbi:hypothetical protein E2C01_068785 [Portunus trituberculatus]|uniref:Uncharacterized protein n=1 Tax=Portunus trituberculatus TaxID=210409 RepID=A0A5B7HYT9_PORTR|nr:hypothetical protein [Portunus trituberculatus]
MTSRGTTNPRARPTADRPSAAPLPTPPPPPHLSLHAVVDRDPALEDATNEEEEEEDEEVQVVMVRKNIQDKEEEEEEKNDVAVKIEI